MLSTGKTGITLVDDKGDETALEAEVLDVELESGSEELRAGTQTLEETDEEGSGSLISVAFLRRNRGALGMFGRAGDDLLRSEQLLEHPPGALAEGDVREHLQCPAALHERRHAGSVWGRLGGLGALRRCSSA